MKKVLITGTSQGLGKALAEEFSNRNYEVIATARNPMDIQIEGIYKKFALDITEPEMIEEVVSEIGNNVSSLKPSTAKRLHFSDGKTVVRNKGKEWMRTVQTIALIVCLLYSFTANAQTTQTPADINKIEPLPRDLEIKLALSALPPHLRDSATVYVLNPKKGFEVAREGSNGFHAFVARLGDDAMRGSWPLKDYRDDILYPISFDKAGAKAQMQVFFDIAKMQANGIPASELKKIIKKRYKTGSYKAPERAGISYMLSPILRTYTNPEKNDNVVTLSIPHVMYYAPHVSNHDNRWWSTWRQVSFCNITRRSWIHDPASRTKAKRCYQERVQRDA